MRRHLVYGVFDKKDDIVIPHASDEQVSKLPLTVNSEVLGFGITSALNELYDLKLYPTEIGIDLLILAIHVYAADTRISRSEESQDSWTREIRLVVPVSVPHLWKENSERVREILNFLTGDRWSVNFRARPDNFLTLAPSASNDLLGSEHSSVSLFSGGLDSLIGAIDLLESGGSALLISHASEGATSDAQYKCFDAIKEHYDDSTLDRIRYWLNPEKSLFTDIASEASTRGRSFLFFALGIFAGSGINKPFKLHVC